jgi:hypothetical protein
MSESCLIIFAKNPLLGKVKTRLASSVGEEKALEIYRILLRKTRDVSKQVDIDRVVYYSDFINCEDLWDSEFFQKRKQRGKSLGERMLHAFEDQFDEGHSKCIVIGTDCFELEPEIIEEALDSLDRYDAVIGPANDGGYYLLGMKKTYRSFFENKPWSTDEVFEQTIEDFQEAGIQYCVLTKLVDVDIESDLDSMKSPSDQ